MILLSDQDLCFRKDRSVISGQQSDQYYGRRLATGVEITISRPMTLRSNHLEYSKIGFQDPCSSGVVSICILMSRANGNTVGGSKPSLGSVSR